MEKPRDYKKEILLIPIGKVLVEILEEIAVALRKTYKLHVRIGRSEEPGTEMYSDERRQYIAEHLLNLAAVRKRDNLAAVLGVVDGDMFAGEKTFVYGLHHPGKGAAVIALSRLRDEFYKKPSKRELFLRRAVTEAIYQVGLAAGLTACPTKSCVLSLSTTLWRLDEKGQAFCDLCAARFTGKFHPERLSAVQTAARENIAGEGPEGEAVVVPELQTVTGHDEAEPQDESRADEELLEPESQSAEEAAMHEESDLPDEPLVADARSDQDE